MNIVANSFFLRNLRNLNFFTINLGKTKKITDTKTKESSFRKLSEFEIKYGNIYNRTILSFGNIGKIMFHEDLHIDRYKYLIFNNDDIYEITWTDEEISDFGNYILDTLRKIDNIDKEEQKEQNNIKESDEYWKSSDIKNGNKKYSINQTLSKEEYRQELLNKFKKK